MLKVSDDFSKPESDLRRNPNEPIKLEEVQCLPLEGVFEGITDLVTEVCRGIEKCSP